MYAAYKYRLVSWCHSRLPSYWHNNIGIIYSKEITTTTTTTTTTTNATTTTTTAAATTATRGVGKILGA